MLIPYKVKNPPRNTPYATITIIVLNVLVYMVTNDRGVMIRRDVVETWALTWGQSGFITIFTSMFLHGGPLHLIGNMLFLWVFGQAVEDRLRPGLYVALYLFTGFAGAAAHAFLGATGAVEAHVPLIGASGCVMGVMGAYWYLFSWSPVCVFYWFLFSVIGTFEVRAFWVIGAYFVLDLINGMLSRAYGQMGGVANFAHVGGAFAGALVVWALQMRRDTSEMSEIKAVQADYGGDLSILPVEDLAKLAAAHPGDRDLVVQYAKRSWERGEVEHLRASLIMAGREVLSTYPEAAVDYLILLRGKPDLFHPDDVLYLARYCESALKPDKALRLYELIETVWPEWPEMEVVLYRSADVYWRMLNNHQQARAKLQQLLTRFPNGTLRLDAEDMLSSLSGGQQGMASAA